MTDSGPVSTILFCALVEIDIAGGVMSQLRIASDVVFTDTALFVPKFSGMRMIQLSKF